MNWLRRVGLRLTGRRTNRQGLQVVRNTSDALPVLVGQALRNETNAAEQQFLESLQERIAQLHARLSGDVRVTSFRHIMQSMDAGAVFEAVSTPLRGARLLYRLSQRIQPAWAVEFGSAFGIGSLSIVSGMKEVVGARFDGFEFEKWRADIAQEGVSQLLPERAQIHSGALEDHFPAIAAANGDLMFAFVDAMHTYEATQGYHTLLASVARPGAVIVYDDIAWSEGMCQFWRELAGDHHLSDVVSVDGRWGIVRFA